MYQNNQTYVSSQKKLPQYVPLNPQKYIQSYVIDFGRVIGKGNFSTVYSAMNKDKPSENIAVKIINLNSMKAQKLQKLVKSEIDSLLSFHHENLISCKDIFLDENWCYIFTELCEGGNLQHKLQMNGPMTQYQSLKILKNVFDGLLHLQKNHMLHRDLKAANIFLRSNGTAVIADFGFSCFINQPFQDLNIGSLPYMAPESLINNLYTDKSDVWAFGVFIYHILHGQGPYSRSHSIQELQNKVLTPLKIQQIRPQISIALKQLILSCLQINWEKRPSFSSLKQSWFYQQLFEGQILTQRKFQTSKNKKLNKSFNRQAPKKALSSRNVKFQNILEEIQHCRTFFKLLSRLESGETVKKEVFANYASTKLNKIILKIMNGQVEFGDGENQSRKTKLKAIAQDYAFEFAKEMKKKKIKVYEGEVEDETIRIELQKIMHDCSMWSKVKEMKERQESKKAIVQELLRHEKEN